MDGNSSDSGTLASLTNLVLNSVGTEEVPLRMENVQNRISDLQKAGGNKKRVSMVSVIYYSLMEAHIIFLEIW